MNTSFRIAEIAGIPIRVHVTFFLILVFGALDWGGRTGTAEGALFGVVLMILLFTCVVLHELGHSVTAKALGIPVREITLLPIGGVAVMTKNPDKPLHELLVAIAGPLVNVVIAIVLGLVVGLKALNDSLAVGPGLMPQGMDQPSLNTLLMWLLAANVSLVIFNLIPAFPMDGGRVLRAILAMGMGMPRATRVASTVGQVIAIAIGIFGLLSGNFMLALVAAFIFFGAGQENAMEQSRSVLTSQKVRDAYNKHALTLAVGDRVSRAVDYILTSYQPDFAVMQGSNPIGVVTRDDVLRALAQPDGDRYVTEIMQRNPARIPAETSLDQARTLLSEQGARVGMVFDGPAYLGLISQEDINEAFAVLTFVQVGRRRIEQQPG